MPFNTSPEFRDDLIRALAALDRLQRDSSRQAFDAAIQAWESLLSRPALRAQPEIYRASLSVVGDVRLRRYLAFKDEGDLNRAITVYEEAISFTKKGSPDLYYILNRLGIGLSELYNRTGKLSDLEEAIEAWRRAVSLAPEDSSVLPKLIDDFCKGLKCHYALTSNLSDLENVIEAYRRALKFIPEDSPDLPGRLNDLGVALSKRYERIGEISDLEEVIETWRKAVRLTSEGSHDLPDILFNLGNALYEQYACIRNLSDLQEAIKTWRRAVSLGAAGSLHLPMFLSNLGVGLSDRYNRLGNLSDLQEAIEAWRRAVSLTPEGSPDLPKLLDNLGDGLIERYAFTENLSDLQEAIEAWRRAASFAPEGSPDLPRILYNLGVRLGDRYDRLGNLSDLQEAIEAYRRALSFTPEGSPDLPRILNNLGNRLGDRYTCKGNLSDLEESIEVSRRAVSLAPEGAIDLPRILDNLGIGLRNRYECIGNLSDLEESIEVSRRAVSLAPEGSPYLPIILNNLGNRLGDRYTCKGNLSDLEESIEVSRRAVSLTPAGSRHLPMFLVNMGSGLGDQYKRIGNLSDLEESIEACRRAVSLTPEGSPTLPHILGNLGVGLRNRYECIGNLSDLEEAIEAWRWAVSLAPVGSPHIPRILENLGVGLSDRYNRLGNLSDLVESFRIYDEARIALDHTFLTTTVAHKLGLRSKGGRIDYHLVETALHLMQESPKDQKLHWRQESIVAAEGAKSRILTELLGRGSIPAPPSIPPKLATLEAKLLGDLIHIDTMELARIDQAAPSVEKQDYKLAELERRNLLKRLEELWGQIEDIGPEAREFVSLRRGDRLSWYAFQQLAEKVGNETAILSMFNLADRIVLFILRAGCEEPIVVEIPFDEDSWKEVWRRFNREVHYFDHSGRREETWQKALRQLFELALPHLVGAKRVIFVPAGFGHLLPWVVAAQQTELDLPWITVPALGSLARLMQRTTPLAGEALVVGNPSGDLLYAEQEAREVAKLLGAEPLLGSRATKESVIELLPKAYIAHFATHAYFNPNSPLDSGIVLADGTLTAREVIQLRICSNLLVLSACETGMSISLGGDEMSGLTQAFLQAGTSSLIASLWKVDDPATATLMTIFYNAWRLNKINKSEAFHQAMAETRKLWPHTYHFGAFTLVGDWR